MAAFHNDMKAARAGIVCEKLFSVGHPLVILDLFEIIHNLILQTGENFFWKHVTYHQL